MQIPGRHQRLDHAHQGRIDMLSTGVRTPVGIKIYGADLKEIERIGTEIETDPQGRARHAERLCRTAAGGYFLDFNLNGSSSPATASPSRTSRGHHVGHRRREHHDTIEGTGAYSVNVRYPRDFRDDIENLQRVLVPTPVGAQIPLGAVADINLTLGPAMIRDENGMLAGYVYVDMARQRHRRVRRRGQGGRADRSELPPGYSLQWSGQYENMLRVRERLKVVIPLTLFLIFVLLYMNTKSLVKTGIVMLAVPFSLVGASGSCISRLQYLHRGLGGDDRADGLDAETGVFMLLFLDLSYDDAKRQGRMKTCADLKEAIIHGAVKRIRPKMMTVMADVHGPDADHVVTGHRRGHDEAHRGPDDRRHLHILHPGAAGLPGDLRHLEVAF